MKKRILSIVSALTLVMVFAVTGVYASDVEGLPNNFLSHATCVVTDDGFILTSQGNYNGYIRFTGVYSAQGSVEMSITPAVVNPNVYAFQFNNGSTNADFSGGFTDLYNVSSSSSARLVFSQGVTDGSYSFSFGRNNASSTTPLDFYAPPNSSVEYKFSSLIINDSVIYDGPSITGEVLDFSIPAGYAFVLDGDCDILERSYYINNSYNFSKNGNNRVNGARERYLGTSYIVDGFSPDRVSSFDDYIQWEALNPNIFGDASNYEFYDSTFLTPPYTNSSYIICYPTLFGYGSENSRIVQTNASDMICHLYINYTTRPTMRWVALESLSEFTNNGDFYTYSVFRPTVADTEGEASQGSGGTVITPENPLPSNGGNHSQPPVNDDNTIMGVLSRLTNTITGLFRSAVDAIETLVNEGSSFMHNLASIFAWLPQPVFAVLVSALTILVVIGVLKLLF